MTMTAPTAMVLASLLVVLGSVAWCSVAHPRSSDDRPVLR